MSEVPGAVRCRGGFSLISARITSGIRLIEGIWLMRSHIKIKDYDGAEFSNAESKLREQGYRLVRKKSEKDLLPGEYIRQEYFRSMNSSGEQSGGTLRWRVS